MTEKKTTVIENPSSDEQLPESILKQIRELIQAGWKREHLMISEKGEVLVDTEAYDHEQLMRSMYPDKDRAEYMCINYPARIVLEE